MTLRGELLDELAGARLFAGDVRTSCLRRAERLLRLLDRVADGRARAALLVWRRSVLIVSEAAEDLIEDLAGADLEALVARVENENAEQRGGQR